MGNPETDLGILAAAGATWRLKELVGEPLAKEILLAGRVLPGRSASPSGLITELVEAPELLDAAHAWPTASPGRTPWRCGSPRPCSTPRGRSTR